MSIYEIVITPSNGGGGGGGGWGLFFLVSTIIHKLNNHQSGDINLSQLRKKKQENELTYGFSHVKHSDNN